MADCHPFYSILLWMSYVAVYILSEEEQKSGPLISDFFFLNLRLSLHRSDISVWRVLLHTIL